jgi:hypothetical protein
VQEHDAHKLQVMECNHDNKTTIMADIYGTKNDLLQQTGLADADDDFDVKLGCMESMWERKFPGFHSWIKINRAENFKSNLVMSSRHELGIQGWFYTNGLELKHKLQKKHLQEEIPKEVRAVSKKLEKWSEEFFIEE